MMASLLRLVLVVVFTLWNAGVNVESFAFPPCTGGTSPHRSSTGRRCSTTTARAQQQRSAEEDVEDDARRRRLISTAASSVLFSLGVVSTTAATTVPSNAAMMDSSQKVFKTGQALGVDAAKARFQQGRESLNYLLQNYDEIVKGGGDNVRRYLGTVGTTSGLYGITKVMKELMEEADDVVEYAENMTEFEFYLRLADTAVYSANFVEFSAAKTKPEKFFDDARKDAIKMKSFMDNMASELKL